MNKIDYYKHMYEKTGKPVWKWIMDNGDETLRLNYNLDSNSVVFDFGGYIGDYSHKISNIYSCNINIYEPISEFYDNIVNRFMHNKKVNVYNIGVGSHTKSMGMIIDGDASYVGSDDSSNIVNIVDVHEILKNHNFINLLKINIEGLEYEVINRMIDTGDIHKIENLQVQFHDFVDQSIEKYDDIKKRLENTHHLTYCYPFVWENWKRNV